MSRTVIQLKDESLFTLPLGTRFIHTCPICNKKFKVSPNEHFKGKRCCSRECSNKDPERANKIRETVKNQWKNLNIRYKHVESMKIKWKLPEYRKKKLKDLVMAREKSHSEESKQKISDSVSKLWTNSIYRENQISKRSLPKYKEKFKCLAGENGIIACLWKNPEFKEKMSKTAWYQWTEGKRLSILKSFTKERRKRHSEVMSRLMQDPSSNLYKANFKTDLRQRQGKTRREFNKTEEGQKRIAFRITKMLSNPIRNRFVNIYGEHYKSLLEVKISELLHKVLDPLKISFTYEKLRIKIKQLDGSIKWYVNDFYCKQLVFNVEGAGFDWWKPHYIATQVKSRVLEKHGIKCFIVRNEEDLNRLEEKILSLVGGEKYASCTTKD